MIVRVTWTRRRSAAKRIESWTGWPTTWSGRTAIRCSRRSRQETITAQLPTAAPEHGESFDRIFEDFERVIVPGLTHWNHPGFFAYFAITASGPGILAEMLAAGLNVQAMLWRTSPAATELEEVTLGWLRDLMGLPRQFEGVIYDTASISTMHALAAAREVAVPEVRTLGLARRSLGTPRIYCTDHTHSSIDKAALALGLGLESIRRVPSDERFAMRPADLAQMIAADRARGDLPVAVVATVGTTSSTSIDPVRDIASVCQRERVWLHVDAAYAGVMAILPAWRHILDGADAADSLVVNPHKWLFTPFDLSALFCRRMDVLRAAFSLVPEYLKTTEPGAVRNLMDTGSAARTAFSCAQALDGAALLRRGRHSRAPRGTHPPRAAVRILGGRVADVRARSRRAVQCGLLPLPSHRNDRR